MTNEAHLDQLMKGVNERLLDEIGRAATAEVQKRLALGQSVDEINVDMKEMMPNWEAWRVQAHRSIRQSLSDLVGAVIDQHREETVVH